MKMPDIIWFKEIDSTNRFALENMDCLASGTMIAAASQSAGRGSKGRSWLSPEDVNVYASILFKDFSIQPWQAAWVGSLSVLDVIRETAPRLSFSVKWPNDVLCSGKKIAGLLCEATQNGIVIGIGLNVNMTEEMLAPLGREATSLSIETGICYPDVCYFAERIRDQTLERWEKITSGKLESIFLEWCNENFLIGRTVELLLSNGKRITCRVQSFTRSGSMVVHDLKSGTDRSIISCDILKF